jgi:uncharacterized protein YoxC
MKSAALLLIGLILLGTFIPTISAINFTPHEDPSTSAQSLDAYSFLTNYAEILGLVASRAYGNASILIEQLKFVSIPDDLRYIINRYSDLTLELINVLDNADRQLDQAEKLLNQYRLDEAKVLLENAGILVAKAKILLNDLQEATSTLSQRLGVFATSVDSKVSEAYSRLQEILNKLQELIDRFHELLTRLNQGIEQIEQQELKPTEITLSINDTRVIVGEYISASGRLTTNGQGLAFRTVTLLLDDNQVANVTTNAEGMYYTTIKIPYRYVHSMTLKSLYTPVSVDRGVYLAAVSPTLAINVVFYETVLETIIPSIAHPGLSLKVNGYVKSNDGLPLTDRTVNIFFDGKKVSKDVSADDGSFSFQVHIEAQTAIGEHILKVDVEAKGAYAGISQNKIVNITKMATQIEVNAPSFVMLPAGIYIEGIVNSNSAPLIGAAVKVELSGTTAATTTIDEGRFNVTLNIPLSSVFAGDQALNVTVIPVEPWQSSRRIQLNVFILNSVNVGLVLLAFIPFGALLYTKSKVTRNKVKLQDGKLKQTTVATVMGNEKAIESAAPSISKIKFSGIKGKIIEDYVRTLKVIETVTNSSLKAQMTLREFLAEVTPKIGKTADSFSKLTDLAEKCLYSSKLAEIEEGIVAMELAEKIMRELKDGNA